MLALFLLVLENLKLPLSISEGHNGLLVVGKLLLETVSLSDGVGKWDLKLDHSKLQMLNSYLILLNLITNIYELFLVHSDELQVLPGDVVVVLFHFLECLLVILHQVIDVLVLTFLNLMDLHLHAKFKLVFQLLELSLVVLDESESFKV